MIRAAICLLAATALAGSALAAPPSYDERPAKIDPAREGWDYEKRVVDIPMRDGVKLHTVILIPKGAHDAGIVFTRTQ